jgi:beta-carotene/zeaxanthin 4-ketolase
MRQICVQHDLKAKPFIGLIVAVAIGILWIGSLKFLLFADIAQLTPLTPLWLLPAILGRTFIQTGLFIVAHDAIHGSVILDIDEASPLENRRLNHCIGQAALTFYALLSDQKLSLNHWQHHRYPGQVGDPDFHDGIHHNGALRYLKFMQGYLDKRQKVVLFFGMSLIFFTLYLGFHTAIANLLLFWVLPIVLSSIQLFLFGTYLPHRSHSVGFAETSNAENAYHATSSNYSLVWSFLTCYHFRYHWEHHEYPSLP